MQDFFIEAINSIRHISIFSILDILVVSYIFYKGYMLIKETRAEQLLKGIVLIIVLATCIVFVNYNSSIDKKLTDSVESN